MGGSLVNALQVNQMTLGDYSPEKAGGGSTPSRGTNPHSTRTHLGTDRPSRNQILTSQ